MLRSLVGSEMCIRDRVNRIVTDSITDYFFTTSETAGQNLKKCGVTDDRIFFVGNTMIDTLLHSRPHFMKPSLWDELKLSERGYIVLTLHRPNNVDDPANLQRLLDEIIKSSAGLPVIFPIHPRTRKVLGSSVTSLAGRNIHLTEPLGYLEFNYIVERAKAVITDSGGITEETTVMSVPCMTLRDSTLRSAGPNSLIVLDKFVFDSTTNAGTLSVSVKKGTLAVATGKIAKETPESVDFRTSTAVIGVRGTEFVIDAGAGNDD